MSLALGFNLSVTRPAAAFQPTLPSLLSRYPASTHVRDLVTDVDGCRTGIGDILTNRKRPPDRSQPHLCMI